jgi:ABC-2 type transport system ATP-binding protein
MPLAVEVDHVRRTFQSGKGLRRRGREVVALDGVSLGVGEGELHGLLGPNGAGKTTLVKILSTLLIPTAGTARVLGLDVIAHTRAVRPLIGIVFGGERGLYNRLTGRQNLRFWAALYNLPDSQARSRCDALLERFGLAERADDRVETYSRGMKQRLHLARGLVHDAQVLFLDEPTIGMDPVASLDFRALIQELKRERRTILLTTHDMTEAEALCDRVTLIDHGRLVAVESPRTLASWIARYERIDVAGASSAVVDRIRDLPGVSAVTAVGDGSVRIESGADGVTQRVLELLVASGVTSVRTSLPSLEEVYIHLIGGRGMRL